MVAVDRGLRLAGYEVYRFEANNPTGHGAGERIKAFFRRLLRGACGDFRSRLVSVKPCRRSGTADAGSIPQTGIELTPYQMQLADDCGREEQGGLRAPPYSTPFPRSLLWF